MTNEEFQKKVNDFYQRNKPLELIDVVAAVNGRHECGVCGNRALKRLCHIRNEERDEEWFIGWNCYEAVENLQEQEQKKAFNVMVKCSQCGKEQRRGELPREAYAADLCKKCWMEKNNIPNLATGMG
jgi:hypothetical protein